MYFNWLKWNKIVLQNISFCVSTYFKRYFNLIFNVLQSLRIRKTKKQVKFLKKSNQSIIIHGLTKIQK